MLINDLGAKVLKTRKTCKGSHDSESGYTIPYLVSITQMKTTKRDTKMKDSIATTMIRVLMGRARVQATNFSNLLSNAITASDTLLSRPGHWPRSFYPLPAGIRRGP